MDAQLNVYRGLENKVGQHNCFLNVVLQSLWHVQDFRQKMLEVTEHNCSTNCIFCALRTVFTNYAFSDEQTIIPYVLRKTLSDVFAKQKRFQEGEMGDAAECMVEVVTSVLNALKTDSDRSHIESIFQLELVEQLQCDSSTCGTISEPKPSKTFIDFFYVTTLRELRAKRNICKFDYLLHAAITNDRQACANEKCKNRPPVTKFLLNKPRIYSIELVWALGQTYDYKPISAKEEIAEVLRMIDQIIDLTRVYESQDYPVKPKPYKFLGMICFYSSHYVACFYSDVLRKWMSFDDAYIKVVGNDWESVKCWCEKNTYRPFLLVYELDEPRMPNKVEEQITKEAEEKRTREAVQKELERPTYTIDTVVCDSPPDDSKSQQRGTASVRPTGWAADLLTGDDYTQDSVGYSTQYQVQVPVYNNYHNIAFVHPVQIQQVSPAPPPVHHVYSQHPGIYPHTPIAPSAPALTVHNVPVAAVSPQYPALYPQPAYAVSAELLQPRSHFMSPEFYANLGE